MQVAGAGCVTGCAQGAYAYRNGSNVDVSYADYDHGYDNPINSYERGSSRGGYTVRTGDTLNSIAANLWGDSALWWKIAEANGLSGQAALVEGQTLILPPGVVRSSNTAQTFTPYDPNDTIGNTSPTAAKPPKKNKCGGLGQILLVVIAVVVSIYTAGAATGLMAGNGAASFGLGAAFNAGMGLASAGVSAATVTAGAIGGMAGSIVSQAVGVVTGIQDEFSWNAVALAGIGGAVGGAVKFGGANWQGAALRGAASNAITQGIGVATGLQKEFSWAGVAAAGIGAGVFSKVSSALPDRLGSTMNKVISGGASAIADAAARSLIEGTDFGDNIRAALPNVVGQVLGEAIAGRIAGGVGSRSYLETMRQRYDENLDNYVPLKKIDGAYDTALADGLLVPPPTKSLMIEPVGPKGQPAPTMAEIVVRPEQRRPSWVVRAILALFRGGAPAAAGAGASGPPIAAGVFAVTRARGQYEHYATGASVTPILNIPYQSSALSPFQVPGRTESPLGFGVAIHSREEASLLADMQMQGASASEKDRSPRKSAYNG